MRNLLVPLVAVVSSTALLALGLPGVADARPGIVIPTAQTPAFVDDASGTPPKANADDPAIWVHPSRRGDSVVLGTLKEGGLAAFDLAGRLLQLVAAPPPPAAGAAPGRFNNVDLLGDLAFVSDRGRDRVRVYRVDPRGAAAGKAVLKDVTAAATPRVFSQSEAEVDEQRTAYGLAVGADRGTPLVVASRRHETRLALLTPVRTAEGVTVRQLSTVDLPASFRLPDGKTWAPCGEPGEGPQVEGMVIDSRHGVLYAAQEDVGIWRIPLSAKGFGQPELIDRVREFGVPAKYDEQTEECVPTGADPGFGGKWLTADAEGLTIADAGHGRGQLVASSQGDSRFVVYDREKPGTVLGTFRVREGHGRDSVEHSDGAAVVTTPLPGYPAGLLAVHDGERKPAATDPSGKELETTGFAYLSWKDVLASLER
ncbi:MULTISPECIES: phytase [unclassified Crossiella]|uniref:phytase n=1 Tax=unclassified Crossiella TaxID=2620835 RepID=UPI001FFEC48F|nr:MULTISPECIES: phytase [unclassified Crossiella]MCK2240795.1 phytase [Crossiella sp. S99.2]MCK2254061.1 phytase [Crossiella sp. S99.1]